MLQYVCVKAKLTLVSFFYFFLCTFPLQVTSTHYSTSNMNDIDTGGAKTFPPPDSSSVHCRLCAYHATCLSQGGAIITDECQSQRNKFLQVNIRMYTTVVKLFLIIWSFYALFLQRCLISLLYALHRDFSYLLLSLTPDIDHAGQKTTVLISKEVQIANKDQTHLIKLLCDCAVIIVTTLAVCHAK